MGSNGSSGLISSKLAGGLGGIPTTVPSGRLARVKGPVGGVIQEGNSKVVPSGKSDFTGVGIGGAGTRERAVNGETGGAVDLWITACKGLTGEEEACEISVL